MIKRKVNLTQFEAEMVNQFSVWKMCERKNNYPTKEIAEDYIRRQNKPLRTYKCPHCFQWHLTSQV